MIRTINVRRLLFVFAGGGASFQGVLGRCERRFVSRCWGISTSLVTSLTPTSSSRTTHVLSTRYSLLPTRANQQACAPSARSTRPVNGAAASRHFPQNGTRETSGALGRRVLQRRSHVRCLGLYPLAADGPHRSVRFQRPSTARAAHAPCVLDCSGCHVKVSVAEYYSSVLVVYVRQVRPAVFCHRRGVSRHFLVFSFCVLHCP